MQRLQGVQEWLSGMALLAGAAASLCGCAAPATNETSPAEFQMRPQSEAIPGTLEEALSQMRRGYPEEQLRAFAATKERDLLPRYYFPFATGLTNRWEMWRDSSPMNRYFRQNGVEHPEDMAVLLMLALHRELNNKEFNLRKEYRALQRDPGAE